MSPGDTKDADVELSKFDGNGLTPTKSNAASVAIGQVEGDQPHGGVQRKLKARHIQVNTHPLYHHSLADADMISLET